MSLSRELRDALERLRGNLSTLAQEHPEAGAFLAALRREAAPLLAQVENDDQRHALLAELSLMACEAGVPGETARRVLMGGGG
ncbi:hypothetical protein ACFOED_10500 [Vulcaniibacterium thermophilum]|uniref:Uncharacterized protein n=1 Tax=Vulcaniibacterium thermophilum TaxID=1169913 RepID=A0A919DA46_9GAMM|nr:hypothetical protein [Vulcaniibacterium thermophilum]GHE27110.1 hypothetical protein GCM10007167_05480 [Vulcaniibacterium thermophilum]